MKPANSGRYVLASSIIGLLLFTAWRALSLGLADHYAQSNPGRALWWRPDHPSALLQMAHELAARNPGRARQLAEAALAADPREGRANRILGQIAERAGDMPSSIRLHETASKLAPRDLPSHVWLERHYLATGKIDLALEQIDLMLRIEPETQPRQFAIMLAMAELPAAQSALARLLSRRPPWRAGFVSYLSREATDSRAVAPLVSKLRAQPGGLQDSELAEWIERLSRDHRWGEGYLVWVGSLTPAQQLQLDNVFNGGFEQEPSNNGFDWRFQHVSGASIERLPDGGANGNLALRVSFEDRRIPFNHVQQLLALAPGRYRLAGRARAEGLRSERGLVWRVICASDGRQIASTDPLMGHSPWRKFETDFEVPAQNCGGQWLQLAVPARIPAEQRIGGRAWFDEVRIVRQKKCSGSKAKPTPC